MERVWLSYTVNDQKFLIANDFTAGDHIDVSAIDANETLARNQTFVLDTGGGFVAGEFRFIVGATNTIIAFNTVGDSTAEMKIQVQNVTNLTPADFLL